MDFSEAEHSSPVGTTRLANLPLCGWAASVALGGLFYYFDVIAPYRDIRGYPKDRLEDYCLWLAATISAAAIVTGVVALVSIRRSRGRLSGMYRIIIGIVLNLLSLPVILFTIFVQAIGGGE